jgi:hypothetical protein
MRPGPAFLVVVASTLSACASAQPSPVGTPSGAVPSLAQNERREWEPWPPPGAPASKPRPVPSGKVVRLAPKEGGCTIRELFDLIQTRTGQSILYDSHNATFKQARVEFIGEHLVDESELFDWLQAVLSYRKLVLVPVGPRSPEGRVQWCVMDMADPSLKSKPVFIDEADVEGLADRDGLYVVTSLRVRDTVDVQRARNALSPLSTATAGIGRIQDVGRRFLVVGDFAPVVAAMKRMLDRINTESSPPTEAPGPGT